jgi:hypothetical protein
VAFRAGNARIGEGIAQRSRRGNPRGGCERHSVDRVASGRETRELGKASHRGHRGGTDVVDKRLSVERGASGRETRALVKASLRGHRGHGEELASWTRKALGGQGGLWAGNACIGENVAQRLRRSQRGDLGWCPENSIGKTPVKESVGLFPARKPWCSWKEPPPSRPPSPSVASVRCFPHCASWRGSQEGARLNGRKALGGRVASERERRREGHVGAVLTVPASKLSIVV